MSLFKAFTALLKIFVFLLVYLCFLPARVHALPLPTDADTTLLRVGFAGNPPFITYENTALGGISYEIWQALAAQAQWRYSTIHLSSVDAALDSLQQGKLDFVVGPGKHHRKQDEPSTAFAALLPIELVHHVARGSARFLGAHRAIF